MVNCVPGPATETQGSIVPTKSRVLSDVPVSTLNVGPVLAPPSLAAARSARAASVLRQAARNFIPARRLRRMEGEYQLPLPLRESY